jgi:hypothetical protein
MGFHLTQICFTLEIDFVLTLICINLEEIVLYLIYIFIATANIYIRKTIFCASKRLVVTPLCILVCRAAVIQKMTYIKSLVFVQGGEKRKTHTFVSSAFVPLFCIYAAA